jgi:hypothetical protein
MSCYKHFLLVLTAYHIYQTVLTRVIRRSAGNDSLGLGRDHPGSAFNWSELKDACAAPWAIFWEGRLFHAKRHYFAGNNFI